MIAKCNLPFAFVESDGYKTFMNLIAPNYKIPRRNAITQNIEKLSAKLTSELKMEITTVKSITFTTDGWSDLNYKSYLGLTAHYLNPNNETELKSLMLGVIQLEAAHTSKYLCEKIEELFEKWGVNTFSQKVRMVTDNAANIKSAASLLVGKENHFGCFAHTLQLVIVNALKVECRKAESKKTISIEEFPVVESVKSIVRFITMKVSSNIFESLIV